MTVCFIITDLMGLPPDRTNNIHTDIFQNVGFMCRAWWLATPPWRWTVQPAICLQ